MSPIMRDDALDLLGVEHVVGQVVVDLGVREEAALLAEHDQVLQAALARLDVGGRQLARRDLGVLAVLSSCAASSARLPAMRAAISPADGLCERRRGGRGLAARRPSAQRLRAAAPASALPQSAFAGTALAAPASAPERASRCWRPPGERAFATSGLDRAAAGLATPAWPAPATGFAGFTGLARPASRVRPPSARLRLRDGLLAGCVPGAPGAPTACAPASSASTSRPSACRRDRRLRDALARFLAGGRLGLRLGRRFANGLRGLLCHDHPGMSLTSVAVGGARTADAGAPSCGAEHPGGSTATRKTSNYNIRDVRTPSPRFDPVLRNRAGGAVHAAHEVQLAQALPLLRRAGARRAARAPVPARSRLLPVARPCRPSRAPRPGRRVSAWSSAVASASATAASCGVPMKNWTIPAAVSSPAAVRAQADDQRGERGRVRRCGRAPAAARARARARAGAGCACSSSRASDGARRDRQPRRAGARPLGAPAGSGRAPARLGRSPPSSVAISPRAGPRGSPRRRRSSAARTGASICASSGSRGVRAARRGPRRSSAGAAPELGEQELGQRHRARDQPPRTPPCRARGRSRRDPRRRAGTGSARSCRRRAPAARSRARATRPCGPRRRRRSRTRRCRSAGRASARAPAWSRCRAWRPRSRRRAARARRRPCSPRRRPPGRRRGSRRAPGRGRRARGPSRTAASPGELRYLGSPSPSTRPPKPITLAAAVVDREHDRGRGSGRSACRLRPSMTRPAVSSAGVVVVGEHAPRAAASRRARSRCRSARRSRPSGRGPSGSRWRAAPPSAARGRTSRRRAAIAVRSGACSRRSRLAGRARRAAPRGRRRARAPRPRRETTCRAYSIRKPIAVPCAPQPKQ